MIPGPCFQALNTIYFPFCYMFAHSDIYFRLHLLLIIISTTCISLSLRRTSAPIHLTSVLGVLGTQETFCIVIAGLLERDSFDLLLPEFDKPWVIHLRETCCCSTNLCTWRPNTVYKNRRVRRHQLFYNIESLISITMKEISSYYSIQSIPITKSKTQVKATKKQTQSHFRFSFSMAIINSRLSFFETLLTLLFESEDHFLTRHSNSN
jgi:hypothetical protein